jgi:hypothetical protein
LTGRDPIFVDLEASPRIDAQNPPDLAKYTVAPPAKPDTAAATATAASSSAASAATSAAPKVNTASTATSAPVAAAPSKKAAGGKSSGAGKGAAVTHKPSGYEQLQALTCVQTATQKLLDTVRKLHRFCHLFAHAGCLGYAALVAQPFNG